MHKYLLTAAICAAMDVTQVASSALATPTAAPLPAAALKTVPCKELANGAPHCKLPDLTAGPTITVGVSGHVVPWGGHVVLTDADVMGRGQTDQYGTYTPPTCYFPISYVLKNIGAGNAGPPATSTFTNEIYFDDALIINRQSLLSLAASSSLPIHTAVYLPSSGGTLYLLIDARYEVAESDETNNIFFIFYSITGHCKDLSSPPVVF
jgi:hypothetical protein